MTPDVIALRARLERVQSREPDHRNIGELAIAAMPTASGETHYVTLTTAHVCPRCPSRRDCRHASLMLAEAETRVIGGDHA